MNKFFSDSPDGFRYFIILIFSILIIGAIAIFAEPINRNNSIILLADSLNSSSVVYFDFGSPELKPGSYDILKSLADELRKSPEIKVDIKGYTDNVGSDEFNLNLSNERAEAVKNYLISLGCNPEQITTEAKGKTEPLNNNSNEGERKLNRRVVFSLSVPNATELPKDREFVNSSLKKTGRDEIEAVISARDTAGEPISNIEEQDVSAMLKWSGDSAEGTVHFIPIDDKKKLAYTIVLDYSPSMFGDNVSYKSKTKSEKITKMENAVKSFVESLPPNSFVKVIKFGKEIDPILPFTKSREIMLKAIDTRSYARGGTALLLAIHTALRDSSYDSNPSIIKTVIAFTDGMDNSSGSYTKDSIYRYSDRRSIKVYTIGLLERNGVESTEEQRIQGEKDLKEIAGETGGFFYNANNADALKLIYNQISAQITNSYHISVKWNDRNLPPKGTKVTACITITIKGVVRTIYKDYVMD